MARDEWLVDYKKENKGGATVLRVPRKIAKQRTRTGETFTRLRRSTDVRDSPLKDYSSAILWTSGTIPLRNPGCNDEGRSAFSPHAHRAAHGDDFAEVRTHPHAKPIFLPIEERRSGSIAFCTVLGRSSVFAEPSFGRVHRRTVFWQGGRANQPRGFRAITDRRGRIPGRMASRLLPFRRKHYGDQRNSQRHAEGAGRRSVVSQDSPSQSAYAAASEGAIPALRRIPRSFLLNRFCPPRAG